MDGIFIAVGPPYQTRHQAGPEPSLAGAHVYALERDLQPVRRNIRPPSNNKPSEEGSGTDCTTRVWLAPTNGLPA